MLSIVLAIGNVVVGVKEDASKEATGFCLLTFAAGSCDVEFADS